MFVEDRQRHCSAAVTWAAPKLGNRAQVKKAAVRLDQELWEHPPGAWAGEIEQTIVPGAGGFREMAFLHKPSRTLVLTDLIVNLEPDKLPLTTRLFAKVTGTLAPDGKAPTYLRLIIGLRQREAAAAAARLVAWAPERVIFAHGRWFERDGTAALNRSLAGCWSDPETDAGHR